MMKFREVNKALVALLGESAYGEFTVSGYESQGLAASEVRGKKRNVQTFYTQGNFPTSARGYGSTDHHMTFTIGFSVSAAASCDLSVLNSVPAPPAAAVAAVLAASQDAGAKANESIDELFELVYQILMDGNNMDLGLPVGTITDRWITTLKKDPPLPMGLLLLLTGEAQFTCRASEEITGLVGVPAEGGPVTVALDANEGDGLAKAAVE